MPTRSTSAKRCLRSSSRSAGPNETQSVVEDRVLGRGSSSGEVPVDQDRAGVKSRKRTRTSSVESSSSIGGNACGVKKARKGPSYAPTLETVAESVETLGASTLPLSVESSEAEDLAVTGESHFAAEVSPVNDAISGAWQDEIAAVSKQISSLFDMSSVPDGLSVDCALSFVYVEYASTTIYRLHKAGRIQDVLRAKIEGTIIDSLVKMMKHRDAFVAAISIICFSEAFNTYWTGKSIEYGLRKRQVKRYHPDYHLMMGLRFEHLEQKEEDMFPKRLAPKVSRDDSPSSSSADNDTDTDSDPESGCPSEADDDFAKGKVLQSIESTVEKYTTPPRPSYSPLTPQPIEAPELHSPPPLTSRTSPDKPPRKKPGPKPGFKRAPRSKSTTSASTRGSSRGGRGGSKGGTRGGRGGKKGRAGSTLALE